VTSRFLDGLSGDPVATATSGATSGISLSLVSLHGDVVRTTSPTAVTSPDGQFNDADEFGVTRDAADPTGAVTANGPRYGWLGAKQRAADTGAGLMLMGVRVYAPVLGRFLQADPVYGGNETTYGYPNNPITMFDLDGRWGMPKWVKKAAKATGRWAYNNAGYISIGVCVVSVGLGCGIAMAAAAGIAAHKAYNSCRGCGRSKRFGKAFGAAAFSYVGKGLGSTGAGRSRSPSKSRRHVTRHCSARRLAAMFAGMRRPGTEHSSLVTTTADVDEV